MSTLKGHLLVASPELTDPNFIRAVVLLFEHSASGAAGVVINRPLEATVASLSREVFDQPSTWEKPICLGGPVSGPLLVLHSCEELSDQQVLPGIFLTTDSDKIQTLLDQRTEPSVVVANYAGWGPGQLEEELAQQAWTPLSASADSVFSDEPTGLWKNLNKLAGEQGLLSILRIRGWPASPSLN